jgi:hypothetical protein
MATTQSGFVKFTAGAVTVVKALGASVINSVAAGLSATRLDKQTVDLSYAGYAKNGCVRIKFSGVTPKNLSLSDTTATADSYDGDTAFAAFSQLLLLNDGAAAITVIPAVSNGASLPFTALTIAAGDMYVFTFTAAVTVDGTHFSLTITPTAGGSIVAMIGGA